MADNTNWFSNLLGGVSEKISDIPIFGQIVDWADKLAANTDPSHLGTAAIGKLYNKAFDTDAADQFTSEEARIGAGHTVGTFALGSLFGGGGGADGGTDTSVMDIGSEAGSGGGGFFEGLKSMLGIGGESAASPSLELESVVSPGGIDSGVPMESSKGFGDTKLWSKMLDQVGMKMSPNNPFAGTGTTMAGGSATNEANTAALSAVNQMAKSYKDLAKILELAKGVQHNQGKSALDSVRNAFALDPGVSINPQRTTQYQ